MPTISKKPESEKSVVKRQFDKAMAEMRKRANRDLSEGMKADIIERISTGEYEFRIAEDMDLSTSAIARAKKDDPEFELQVNEARTRALWTKLELLLEHFEEAMTERDVKYSMTADRLANHLRWLAERLIPALAPTQNVNMTSTVIQWGSPEQATVIDAEVRHVDDKAVKRAGEEQ